MMTDARRLTAQDVIHHMQVPETGDLYVIGCFEKRVTIRSQQVRALNLIYALYKEGRVPLGGNIAIVGGGAAGMTAAAGAARLGYHVTVLERKETLLPIFQGNTTRWLHPYIFDWPETPEGERHDGGTLDPDEAGLPLLSWKADVAENVAKELMRKWEVETKGLDIRVRRGVASINLNSRGQRRVEWNLHNNSPDKGHDRGDYFDAVLLAVGFGEESKYEGIPWMSYWMVDSLHQGTGKAERHLISGCGDGGLIDLLRVKLRRFNHKQFTEDFVRLTGLEPLKQELLSIEEQARKQSDPGAYLRDQYEALKSPEVKIVDDFISKKLRDTQATLTGLEDSPLTLNASILHRFLVSRLINRFGVHYRPGGFTLLPSETTGYKVRFKQGGKPEPFDHITCRHGPERPSTIEVDFPNYAKQFEKLRERNVLDQTRWPMWEKGIFDKGGRRGGPPPPGPARVPQAPFIGITVESLKEGFKGREQALEALHTLLQETRKVALRDGRAGRVYAHGGGGIGKSRLAIEYAYRQRKDYPGGVFFARMEKRSPLAIWAELARKLFPERELTHDDEAALAFVQHLGNSSLGPQLLIFDDVQADSRDELVARLRKRVEVRGHTLWPIEHSHVSLLMTTRMRDIPSARGLEVERLDREPAKNLLLEKAGVKSLTESEQAAAVVLAWEVLGGHPLALSLAGSYIGRLGLSFSEYQKIIRQKGLTDRLLEAAREIGVEIDDHERSIAATYELSWKQLDADWDRDKLARYLLRIASFLEPGTPIDRKLLLRLAKELGQVGDPEAVGLALARLTRDLALLDTSDGGEYGSGAVSIHPLVADYTRWRMDEPARQEVQLALLKGLSTLFPQRTSDIWRITLLSENNDEWEWLSPAREAHVNAVLEKTQSLISRVRGTLLFGISTFYRWRQNWASVRRTLQELLPSRRQLVGQSSNDAALQHDLARSLNILGDMRLAERDWMEALKAFEEALSLSQGLLQMEPNNAEWQHDAANYLQRIGDVRLAEGNRVEALKAFEKALSLSQGLLQMEPNNAEWQRNEAMTLSRIGDVQLAEEGRVGTPYAFAEALSLSLGLLQMEPNNALWQHDAAVLFNRIGNGWLAEGNRVGALKAFEKALSLSRGLLQMEPNNAGWQRNVAICLQRIGDVRLTEGNRVEALKAFEEALSLSRGLLQMEPNNAEWQRDTAICLQRIGDVRLAEGNQVEPLKAFEEALSLSRGLLQMEPNNAMWQCDAAAALSRLGHLLLARGERAEAFNAYKEALEIVYFVVQRNPANEQWRNDFEIVLDNFVKLLFDWPSPDLGEGRSLLAQMRDNLQRLAAENRFPNPQRSDLIDLISLIEIKLLLLSD